MSTPTKSHANLLLGLIFTFLLTTLLSSCAGNDHVVSNRLIQKRKYQKGFHLPHRKNKTTISHSEIALYERPSTIVPTNELTIDSCLTNDMEHRPILNKPAAAESLPQNREHLPLLAAPPLRTHELDVHRLVRHQSLPKQQKVDLKFLKRDKPKEVSRSGKVLGIISIVAAIASLAWMLVAFLSSAVAFFLLISLIFGGTSAGTTFTSFFIAASIAAFAGLASVGSLITGFFTGLMSRYKSKMPVTGIVGLILNGSIVLLVLLGLLGVFGYFGLAVI